MLVEPESFFFFSRQRSGPEQTALERRADDSSILVSQRGSLVGTRSYRLHVFAPHTLDSVAAIDYARPCIQMASGWVCYPDETRVNGGLSRAWHDGHGHTAPLVGPRHIWPWVWQCGVLIYGY